MCIRDRIYEKCYGNRWKKEFEFCIRLQSSKNKYVPFIIEFRRKKMINSGKKIKYNPE